MHRLVQRLSAGLLVVAVAASVAGCGGGGAKKDVAVLPTAVVPKAFCSKLDLKAASTFSTAPVTSFSNSFADGVYSCIAKPDEKALVALGIPKATIARYREIVKDQKAKVADVPGVPADKGLYYQLSNGTVFVNLLIGTYSFQCSWASNAKSRTIDDFGSYCVAQAALVAK